MADPTVGRNYHSEALLLPDGRVITLGSDPLYSDADNTEPGKFEKRIEIYSPPYLFQGDRPADRERAGAGRARARRCGSAAPTRAAIKSARLVRPSAVTHVTDVEQRSIELDVRAQRRGHRRDDPRRAPAWCRRAGTCCSCRAITARPRRRTGCTSARWGSWPSALSAALVTRGARERGDVLRDAVAQHRLRRSPSRWRAATSASTRGSRRRKPDVVPGGLGQRPGRRTGAASRTLHVRRRHRVRRQAGARPTASRSAAAASSARAAATACAA